MAVSDSEVDSVASFINAVLAQPPSDSGSWFRGMADSTWKLVSTLNRRLVDAEVPELLKIERRLITRFRQRSLPIWPEGYPQSDWEQLFAMQHYGIPTRLLDWSESPLVAAYFAANSNLPSEHAQPIVWQLDPIALNRHNSRLDGYGDAIAILATTDSEVEPWAPSTEANRFAPWPIAIYGTHNSGRIVAQQGTFTVSGKEPAPLEESPAVRDNDHVLTSYRFTCSHQSIKKDLAKLAIRHGSIFPDLLSIARDIGESELNHAQS